MVITYQSNDSVSLKTKTETVTLGPSVRVGDHTLPGAGEYDIATIQCEARSLSVATAFFIRSEDLNVAYLTAIDADVTKLDIAANTNILVIDVRSDDTPDTLKPIIKALEPSYVFLIGTGATPEFSQALNLPPYESSTLKITRSGLPLEGTSLVPRS